MPASPPGGQARRKFFCSGGHTNPALNRAGTVSYASPGAGSSTGCEGAICKKEKDLGEGFTDLSISERRGGNRVSAEISHQISDLGFLLPLGTSFAIKWVNSQRRTGGGSSSQAQPTIQDRYGLSLKFFPSPQFWGTLHTPAIQREPPPSAPPRGGGPPGMGIAKELGQVTRGRGGGSTSQAQSHRMRDL